MSTRSFIGKIRKDRSVDVIYCHFDGYLEHVGYILYTYYAKSERIDKLLALGDISCLYPKLAPDSGCFHSYDHPQVDVTVAYARDRGESGCELNHYQNLSEFLIDYDDSWCEWVYLFDELDQKWYYAQGVIYGEDDLMLLASAFEHGTGVSDNSLEKFVGISDAEEQQSC